MTTSAREELDLLVEQHGGTITPQQVVEFAKDKRTALHKLFVWDDSEAARRYREIQAQGYIRAVVRLLDTGKERVHVRAFVNLSQERGTHIYRPIDAVLADEEMAECLMEDAKRELRAFQTKFRHLSVLAPVLDAITVVLDGVDKAA